MPLRAIPLEKMFYFHEYHHLEKIKKKKNSFLNLMVCDIHLPQIPSLSPSLLFSLA